MVLGLDQFGGISENINKSVMDVDQNEGEVLELWKTREDGFLFVYSDRLEVGYWVLPSLVEVLE